MPTGVMQWFDPRSGEGVITSRRGDYAVRAEDVEPHARVPGARVHFDRVRADGAEHAVRVRLRRGGRTSPHHHRVGDLKGAHHPEAKGRAASQPAPPPREDHPVEIAQQWLRAVRTGDMQTAAALHASDVVIHHTEGRSTSGARAVQRWLQRAAGTSSWAAADLRPRDDTIEVVWRSREGLEPTTGMRLHIAHGRITELWDTRPEAMR